MLQPRGFIFIAIKRNVKRKIYHDEISVCLADNTYTTLFLNNNAQYIISKPLSYFENLLPKSFFFRASRSLVVNLNHIVELNTGKPEIEILTGIKFTTAKTKLKALEARILSLQNQTSLLLYAHTKTQ